MPSSSETQQPGIPAPVAEIARLMSRYPARWALCGGWAVDAWLGEQTRDHPDTDIAVFAGDEARLLRHLAGWQLVAHDVTSEDEIAAQWDGRRLALPAHIHGRSPEANAPLPDRAVLTTGEGFTLDIQVNQRDGDVWLLSASPRIALPIERGIRPSPWGVPAVSAEALLFYKSREMRARDRRDFAALLPRLTGGQRAWLREAIAAAGHPWLDALRP